jgi:hypothetical protein
VKQYLASKYKAQRVVKKSKGARTKQATTCKDSMHFLQMAEVQEVFPAMFVVAILTVQTVISTVVRDAIGIAAPNAKTKTMKLLTRVTSNSKMGTRLKEEQAGSQANTSMHPAKN